jgi:hypothetical protein
MTLDDFLRALESLIDDRETSDDSPGEGNFGCEECRACNHCRFCIGCDSCEDCTYCEECIDCTSATQTKRCVSCQKVSYCDDSRECKGSRYLTLCVSCNDCVHCLACVGLEGAEFYVLNEKRTRKEYFAVLRQVQELMAGRMNVGWRPPNIGLASDIVDALVAGRDTELTAAPWLDDGRDDEPIHEEPERPASTGRGRDDWSVRDEYGRPPTLRDDRPGRGEFGRDEYGRERARGYPDEPEVRRTRDPRRDDELPSQYGGPSMSSPPLPEPREPGGRDWIHDPPEYGSSYAEREDERTRVRSREAQGRQRPRGDFGGDLGRELDGDDWDRDLGPDVGPARGREPARTRDASWGREPDRGSDPGRGREPARGSDLGRAHGPERGSDSGRSREPDRGSDSGRAREPDRGSDSGRSREPDRGSDTGRVRQPDRGEAGRREPQRDFGWDSSVGRERGHEDRGYEDRGYEDRSYEREPESGTDVPRRQEQQPTQPFTRQRERDPFVDPRAVPRAPEHSGRGRDDFGPASTRDSEFDDLERPDDAPPVGQGREPSSPWIDDEQAQANRLAKRGSLRRAGRPARPTDGEPGRDATGTGSGSGSASERRDGTHTGTGLRLGRKPKRR